MDHARAGIQLMDAGHYTHARPHLKKALRRAPADGTLMQRLGMVEVMAGRVAPGLALLTKGAKALDDPDAWQRLAAYLHRAGRDGEATKALRRALGADPGHLRALRDFAMMASLDALKVSRPLFTPARRAVADPACSANERALAHTALSRLADRLGRYEEAMDHALAAGALDGVANAPTRAIARSIAAAWTDIPAGAEAATPAPIFILGMPRSGTTLLEQCLGNHPALRPAGELAAGRLAAAEGARAVGLTAEAAISAAREAYLAGLEAVGISATSRWIDKQPDNLFAAGLLARAFPGARFLYIQRCHLDCASSCLLQRFADPAYSYTNDPAVLAEALLAGEEMAMLWRESLPGGLITLAYEDLATAPERCLQTVLAALELPWDERVLQNRTGRIIHTASATAARGAVTPASIGRWRRYENRLGPLIEMLGAHGRGSLQHI